MVVTQVLEDVTRVPDEILAEMFNQDPVGIAEAISGRSSEHDSDTINLGLWLRGMQRASIERQLRARNDTLLHDTVKHYISVIEQAGFENVLRIPYVYDDVAETCYTFFHPQDGALLVFHTNAGWLVDGAGLYYQWKPGDSSFYPGGTGAILGDLWVGHIDAREGLIFRMSQLRKHGTFHTPWTKVNGWPHLSPWIVHPGDGKPDNLTDFEILVEKRLSLLPNHVQRAIGL